MKPYEKKLLEEINSRFEPITIEVKPESYSKYEDCFLNVFEKVNREAGEIIYGWKIHESKLLVEAERHAVWRSPQGEFVDPTPDKLHSRQITFIQDDKNWKYEGQYTDNIRVNKTDNRLVDDLILVCATITKLYQTGRRDANNNLLLLEPVLRTIQFLEQDKIARELFIHSNNTIDSICYCKQQIRYRHCHGRELEQGLLELVDKINGIVNAKTLNKI